MGVRAGLLASALVAVLALGLGGAPVHAATTAPTLMVEVIGQGTVTGTGINCGVGNLSCYSAYGSAASVDLTAATTASGWSFARWEDDASPCGTTAASCGVTPTTTPATATAVFQFTGAVTTSTLTVSSTDGAVANGSGNYPIDCDPSATSPTTDCSLTVITGSTLTMAETPDSGSVFNGWGSACSGSGPSCAVYLQSNKSVSAGFVSAGSTTLTVTVDGNGSVSGGGISCGAGATCSAPEASNATVTLTATPQSGYVLTGWSGGCTGTQSTCTMQMSSASPSATASFAPLTTLAVTVSGDGYVEGGGIGCDAGQTCTAGETPDTSVTLTAHPNSGGSVFWSGCTSTAGLLCTVTIGNGVQSVTVTFSGGGSTGPVATNSLSVTVSGGGYVIGTSGSASIYCTAAGGAGCTATVQANTTLVLIAVPASGVSGDFAQWLGACSSFTTTSCTLTMNTAKTVEADFAGGDTTYLLSAQPTGSGTISGAGLHCGAAGGSGCSSQQAAGATVTLTATPAAGATFTDWGGACSGTTPTCSVVMSVAKTVTAAFTSSGAKLQSLSISVGGAGAVTATGGLCESTAGKTKSCTQQYAAGTKVTLTAKPSASFALIAWTGACKGTKKICTVTMSAAQTVGAKFAKSILAATHKPTVVHTKKGYRITLWFHAGVRGSAAVAATRSGKAVVKRKVAVKPGGRHVLVTVKARGTYVVKLTLAKHSLRWRVKV
ncbi:MAG: InlB B-repeat-containing protein [Gaiellaceae bacterium]